LAPARQDPDAQRPLQTAVLARQTKRRVERRRVPRLVRRLYLCHVIGDPLARVGAAAHAAAAAAAGPTSIAAAGTAGLGGVGRQAAAGEWVIQQTVQAHEVCALSQ